MSGWTQLVCVFCRLASTVTEVTWRATACVYTVLAVLSYDARSALLITFKSSLFVERSVRAVDSDRAACWAIFF